MKKKILLGILACLSFSVATHAQIGYQVALLNSATGEPRANETVKAEITITDTKNGIVCSETQSVTSNDFGILSFTVGNADTFKDVAIGRLPLFISVTVNEVLIGKSQILNVPVAEVANRLKSDFTLDELCGKTWNLFSSYGNCRITFNSDYSYSSYAEYSGDSWPKDSGKFEIVGNTVYCYVIPENYENTWGKLHLHVLRLYNGDMYECQ